MPTRPQRQTRKLTAEQRLLMVEWIADGLTNDGITAHIQHFNATHDLAQQFPTISPSGVSYWRLKFKRQVATEQRRYAERHQEAVQRGLRNRETRINWLVRAAEKLIPYLGEANAKGEFSASQQFLKLIQEITKLVDGDPKRGSNELGPLDLSGFTTEQLQAVLASL